MVLNNEAFGINVVDNSNFALSEIFEALLEWIKERCYQIQALYYARGPGSFMAMKLTHVFMHTWAQKFKHSANSRS
ncbi:hypothetical protein [Helicobacter suis]|uniref:hypothetical protein n=1 Tax=Helicobacter suis TaxID=104628 RepID=UPI0013D341F8|nr:hypothetical protein [Helicobacter suis]